MRTIETIAAMLAESRENYRAAATAAREAVKALEGIYRETIGGTPAETIAAYVKRVGYDTAVSTVATLVNLSAADGRISRRCADWAAAQEHAWDAVSAVKLWLFSDRIHKAHLDQLAAALMEYQPEGPEEEAAEEPATCTAKPAGMDLRAWRELRNYLQGIACTVNVHSREYKNLCNRIKWIHDHRLTWRYEASTQAELPF